MSIHGKLVGSGLLHLIFGVSCFLFPNAVYAGTYYVAMNGSDSNSCQSAKNSSTPKRTINAGTACMSGGDTLIIRAGTYAERIRNNIPSGTSASNPTTIKANALRQAILKPSGSGIVVQIANAGARHIVIDGLIIDAGSAGGPGQGYRGLSIGEMNQNPPVTDITIRNAVIRNSIDTASCIGTALGTSRINLLNSIVHSCTVSGRNERYARLGVHGIYWHSANSLIEGNEFYDINGLGMQIYDAKGRSFDNVTVRNNYVHDTGRHNDRGNPGILLGIVNNALIANNIVSKTGWIGISTGDGKNVHVVNNTVSGVSTGIRNQAKSGVIKNNIIAGASRPVWNDGGAMQQSNNVTSDPKFVNASVGNFHLQQGFPAINAGISLSDVPCDFDGNKRPAGSGYDIGAFEYGAGPGQDCTGGERCRSLAARPRRQGKAVCLKNR